MSPYKDYMWALNKVKLQQAYEALAKSKLLNNKVDLDDEDTVRAEYAKRGGLVRDEKVPREDAEEAPIRRGRGRATAATEQEVEVTDAEDDE